ncbi:MAG: regulator of volume decrease after cellular swelling-domain-containing protein [Benjaminiella poitrasii]|nr:MAG: regulator of volume decrease after cellular swelling-domain-containing protein [Benjaminiella poitrasii]
MTVTLLNDEPEIHSLKPRYIQKFTALVITPPLGGSGSPLYGELSVCEDQLYFYSESSSCGIAVEYPDITIHAISRQDGEPSIYCQLNSGIFFPNQTLPETEEEREDTVTELRFIPRDSGSLEALYMAMSDCSALHPDHEFMAEQEDYEDEEFYADPSDEAELNEVQQAALRHLESVFQPPPSTNGYANQFEDAEENHQFQQ